ncbi:IF factor, partial [Syrrhaptes paradoxus]|nr:IF factor [Syrrhaptes paradoxus]
ESGGVIGNIYSMGLALQALGSTGKFYAPRPWDCAQAFSVVYGHDYRQPTAVAQLLPALLGRSYLHAADPDCAAGRTVSPQLSPSPKLPTVGVPRATAITVTYSIVNQLQGQPFSFTVAVAVPPGSTLLDVMEAAKEKDPHAFSFVTTDTSWGPFVVSIHGLAGDNGDRTYWRFLSGTKPLPEGIGTYTPQDREHIQAVFSKY